MLCVVVGVKDSGNVTAVVLVVVISGALGFARARSFTHNAAHSRARFCKVRSADQQKQPHLEPARNSDSLLPAPRSRDQNLYSSEIPW